MFGMNNGWEDNNYNEQKHNLEYMNQNNKDMTKEFQNIINILYGTALPQVSFIDRIGTKAITIFH